MADNARTTTSTQIRNMYSDGMSYMNIKFFNTNLMFSLYPFMSKDNLGKSSYDMKSGQSTTVNYESAYALYKTAQDIINGNIQETNLTIPCASGATLILERKLAQNGAMETIFSLSKNNMTIPFRFQTISQQVKTNGQITTQIIETGLGVFIKTIEGYLTGINADRHLDKLTDDFAKLQEGNDNNQNGSNGGFKNNYRGNGNYQKRQYNGNNNGGYRKQYNGNTNFNNNSNGWNNSQPNQQDFSSYNVPN